MTPPPVPLPSPSATSTKSSKHVPLLSLAPPALALGDELSVGEPGEDNNVGEIWNVITRAADLVKDGERLENLAWRHWGQPRRTPSFSHSDRRQSTSSQGSASSALIQTPQESSYFTRFGPGHPHPRHQSSCQQQRMSFGAALLLLVEKNEGNFKDWVEDAKRGIPCSPPLPTFSVRDTPQRPSPENGVQIRLVEPTPVPSRAGSIGGNSMTPTVPGRDVPPVLKEDVEEEEAAAKAPVHENVHRVRIAPIDTERARAVSPRKKGKFFFQSSPGKGSGSDTATSPHNSSKHESPPPATMAPPASFDRGHPRRRSSGDASAVMAAPRKSPAKRHVSLATMRGRFQSEKRKAAEAIAQKHDEKAGNEESGWEDEESDWEDEGAEAEKQAEEGGDEEEIAEEDDEGDWSDEEEGEKEGDNEKAVDKAEKEGEEEDDEDWSDEDGDAAEHEEEAPKPEAAVQLKSPTRKPTSPSKKSPSPQRPAERETKTRDPTRRRSNSRPRPGLATLTQTQSESGSDSLKRRTTWHGDRSNTTPNLTMSRQPPPAPAPAPAPKLSKKERQAEKAERAKIEARLDAQRKREMFAKQNVLGGMGARQSSGLLASALQRGASMVDLPTVSENHAPIKTSPTHVQLTSLAHSPHPGPSLLRSKSTAAMPVQSGVSVTVTGGHLSQAAGKNAAPGSSSESHRSKKTKPVVELESDSEDGDDDYLNTSHIHQKLAELDTKQEAKAKAKAEAGSVSTASVKDEVATQAPATVSRALPVTARANEFGVVQPMMTPTTRRRNIIMAEMSESLRRNVVLEREKSSTGLSRILSGGSSRTRPPPSMVPSHHSAVNLTQYAQPEPLLEHHHPQSARTVNPPYPYNLSEQDAHASSVPHDQHSTIEQRKRPAPNVLAGGNLLRPLTRVGPMSGKEEPSMGSIGRTQSSGTLGNGGRGETVVHQPQAPAMVRSATTDGDGGHSQRERREWKRINLMDTSYRIHGW
ncbi:hypothetical protein IAR50_001260 [Cryptococcus sp. DSM 104548]